MFAYSTFVSVYAYICKVQKGHDLNVISSQAEFFNNYLRDVDRPMPLEPTLSSSSALQSSGQTPGGGGTGEESPAGVTAPPWGQGGPIMIFGRGGLLVWNYRNLGGSLI